MFVLASLVRPARRAALFVVAFATMAWLWAVPAFAAGIAQLDPNQLAIVKIVTALVTIVLLALPVIGVTGGLRQVFDDLPDLTIGRWTVKDGLWASWVCGALVVAIAWVGAGVRIDLTGDPGKDFALVWALVSFAANLIHSTVYDGGTPESTAQALAKALSAGRFSGSV